MKGLLWLTCGTAAFCGLLAYPTRLLWPDEPTLAWNAAAALVCLVPTALTLLWTRWAFKGQPEQQLLAVMGGTVVRMGFVLAVAAVLYFNVKEFEHVRFWVLVVVYYLFTLALEMTVIVRATAAAPAQPKD